TVLMRIGERWGKKQFSEFEQHQIRALRQSLAFGHPLVTSEGVTRVIQPPEKRRVRTVTFTGKKGFDHRACLGGRTTAPDSEAPSRGGGALRNVHLAGPPPPQRGGGNNVRECMRATPQASPASSVRAQTTPRASRPGHEGTQPAAKRRVR